MVDLHKYVGTLTVGTVNAVEIRPGPSQPGHTLTLGGPGDTVAVGPGTIALGFSPPLDVDLTPYETIVNSHADDEATLNSANIYTDNKMGALSEPLDPKGLFGSTSGDLPSIAVNGDTYWCEEDDYVSLVAGFTANRADMAIWTTSWNIIPATSTEGANKALNETITGNWTYTKPISASTAPTHDSHLTNKEFVDFNLSVMLTAANNYTDYHIDDNAPSLEAYQTIIRSEMDDQIILEAAKTYTDEMDLSSYETITGSKVDDAAVLNTAKTYTDEQISSIDHDLTPYETKDKSVSDDAATLQLSKDHTATEITTLKTYTEGEISVLSEKSIADDATTLEDGKTYTNEQIAAMPDPAPGPLNDHSDVDLISKTPEINDVLKWNGNNWIPGELSGVPVNTIVSIYINDAAESVRLQEDGWFLCDGTNETPNLTGQFIRGGTPGFNVDGSKIEGNQGFTDGHVLSSGQLASHNHSMTHVPRSTRGGGDGSDSSSFDGTGWTGSAGSNQSHWHPMDANPNHTYIGYFMYKGTI